MKKLLLAIFLIYFLLATFFTAPLVFKMSSSTYGYAGDNFGAIHYFWWWKKSRLLGADHRDSFLEEAPFGVRVDRESGAAFYYLPLKFLTLITDEVLAYNLVLLLSFPAAALSMFFLVYSLTKNAAAGFVAGLIYSFSPYHFWKAYNHLDLALIWPLPLYVWALVRLIKEKAPAAAVVASEPLGLLQPEGFKSALLIGVTFAMVVLTNFYYGYFMILFTLIFLPFFWLGIILRKGRSGLRFLLYHFITLSLSALISLIITLPFTYQILAEARRPGGEEGISLFKQEAFRRPLDNLISLSARPWDYLIPSQDNPLFGAYVPRLYQWIQTKSEDFKTISAPPHERTIYLGWLSIVFSLAAVYLCLKSRLFREKYGRTVSVLAATTLVLAFISLPPFVIVKNIQTNLPAFYLYRFFPMFRAYARLGVVVLLGLALLASFSLAHFLNYKNRRPKTVIFFTGLLTALVLLEFANIPSPKVVDFSVTPKAYAWLAGQPGEKIILEWPPSFNVAEGFLWQRVHQKGLANWSSQSPYYPLWQSLPDLYLPTVSRKLAGLGVDYVLVHKELLFPQPNPVDDLWYTRAVKDPERYQTAPAGMSLVLGSPEITVLAVNKDNPAKILTITNRWQKIDTRLLGGSRWPWFGGDNHFYFYNLLEEKKEVRVFLNYSLTAKDQRKLKNISFNGQTRPLTGDNSVLVLKPGENDLWFRLDKDYPPQEPVNFQSISLLIDL